MAHAHRLTLSAVVEGLPQRVRRLSRGPLEALRARVAASPLEKLRTEISPGNRRRVLGVVLLLASAGLGLWAYDRSGEEILSGWKRSHLPSSAVWDHALLSRGYTRITDPRLLVRLMRSLPSQIDAAGAIWAAPDANWLTVYSGSNETMPAEVFCFLCAIPPLSWTPSGKGWDGFDHILAVADRALPELRARGPKKAEKPQDFKDPREIRY